TGRQLLARRLARYGFSFSGIALGGGAVRAAISASLVDTTVHAATGPSVVLSPCVSLLVKGAFTTMLLKKLQFVLALVMLMGVLGATGLAYRATGQATPAAQPETRKSPSEVDVLRKEVELLRLNLQVVLEKVRAQEEELRGFRRQSSKAAGQSKEASTFRQV